MGGIWQGEERRKDYNLLTEVVEKIGSLTSKIDATHLVMVQMEKRFTDSVKASEEKSNLSIGNVNQKVNGTKTELHNVESKLDKIIEVISKLPCSGHKWSIAAHWMLILFILALLFKKQ